jgi:hypothetical protein
MSIGVPVDKMSLDAQSGSVARKLNQAFEEAINMGYYLEGKTEDDLIALGYTSQEVAVLKTAFVDLTQLADIYRGVAALAAPKDFRAFARQLFAWS